MPHRALSVVENLPDQSILQRIGNTPLIRIRLLEKEFPHITFYAKAEWFNPGGPVKDRPALRMIEEAARTGPEIVDQTHGEVTHFIAGIGTSGTLMGAGRFLKRHNRGIRVIAAEPSDGLHGLEGLKHMASSIVPGIYDPSVHDEKISVPTEVAYELAHDLARTEGLLVGNSSGAAVYAAREVARRTSEGVFVMVFPDGGDRYLSSGLYRRKF